MKICKVRDQRHYTGECDLKYCIRKKIPAAFHNRSNYDYHFIITQLGEETE